MKAKRILLWFVAALVDRTLIESRRHLPKMRVLVVAVSVMLCACSPPGEPIESALSAEEVSALTEEAEEACRCARSSGSASECWAIFRERTSRLEFSGGYAAACFPISTSVECYNQNEAAGEFCVPTGHTLFGDDQAVLCSEQEARAVEAVYAHTLEATGNDERALEAARAAARDLMRGQELQAPSAEGGCGG